MIEKLRVVSNKTADALKKGFQLGAQGLGLKEGGDTTLEVVLLRKGKGKDEHAQACMGMINRCFFILWLLAFTVHNQTITKQRDITHEHYN